MFVDFDPPFQWGLWFQKPSSPLSSSPLIQDVGRSCCLGVKHISGKICQQPEHWSALHCPSQRWFYLLCYLFKHRTYISYIWFSLELLIRETSDSFFKQLKLVTSSNQFLTLYSVLDIVLMLSGTYEWPSAHSTPGKPSHCGWYCLTPSGLSLLSPSMPAPCQAPHLI